jgi:hypothetical protein
MTKELKFENVGMGIALAAGWFEIAGARRWVDFMSASEGRGQRRTWTVTANHYVNGRPEAGKAQRVTITKRECFRYEAADEALAELAAWLSK